MHIAGQLSKADLSTVTVQTMLEAMDGLAYIVSDDGAILAVSETNWTEFAVRNGDPRLTSASVIGTSLFSMISGAEVRRAYHILHEAVCSGAETQISFDYRCDAPETERHMRMSLGRIGMPGALVGVLYQSVIIAEFQRPPMNIFSPEFRLGPDGDAEGRPLIKLCSYCHDVAWPLGTRDVSWVKPEEYYSRGGPANVWVSHGMCPTCFERVIGHRAASG